MKNVTVEINSVVEFKRKSDTDKEIARWKKYSEFSTKRKENGDIK